MLPHVPGLERVGAKLEVRVVEALQARDPARGAIALAALQRAVPDYPRLDALRAELLTLSRSMRAPISVAPPAATNAKTRECASAHPGARTGGHRNAGAKREGDSRPGE